MNDAKTSTTVLHDERCRCPEILNEDASRHFKGCDLRERYPEPAPPTLAQLVREAAQSGAIGQAWPSFAWAWRHEIERAGDGIGARLRDVHAAGYRASRKAPEPAPLSRVGYYAFVTMTILSFVGLGVALGAGAVAHHGLRATVVACVGGGVCVVASLYVRFFGGPR